MSSAQELNRELHWLCARRLCERRHQLGLTQLDVVSRLFRDGASVTNRAISAMENGQAVDVGRLPALARALECSITYLLGLTDEPTRWTPDTERWSPPVPQVPVPPNSTSARTPERWSSR